MTMKNSRIALPLAAFLSLSSAALTAQNAASPAPATQTGAPRQSGTVKAVTPQDFVLTLASGQDYAVTVPASAHILLVDPATRDLKNAQPGTMADVAAGDKAIVLGTAGDAGQMMTATRVLLLKSGAIAALHAGEQAAWARSLGGIVKTVDSSTGVIMVANGSRNYTINTSASTVVRRYAGASIRFEDAVKSTVTAVQAGDQVQARGQRSADGMTLAADEIVTGSFSNFSGTLTAVDTTAGTVTLKDLATKKTVTVAISGQTNLRKLPAGYGQGAAGASGAGGSSPAGANGQSATGSTAPSAQGGTGGGGAGAGASGRSGAGHLDLSRIMNRLPTETAAELKQGDAVMIVASNAGDSGNPTAITLLSGVEKILAASPAGQNTLSPWSLGSQGEAGEGAGAGSGGR